MGRGSSSLSESNEKPLGGSGTGEGNDFVGPQPFKSSPEDLKAAIGTKGVDRLVLKMLLMVLIHFTTSVQWVPEETLQKIVNVQ